MDAAIHSAGIGVVFGAATCAITEPAKSRTNFLGRPLMPGVERIHRNRSRYALAGDQFSEESCSRSIPGEPIGSVRWYAGCTQHQQHQLRRLPGSLAILRLRLRRFMPRFKSIHADMAAESDFASSGMTMPFP